MARDKQQGICRSLVFTSILRALGPCVLISMLALASKSYAQVNASQLALDSVENFAAYSTGTETIGGSTTINGDVGLGPNATQNFGSGFTINGAYRVDSGANNSHSYSGVTITGGTVGESLTNVSSTVDAVSSYADSLSPNQTLSMITTQYTVTGDGTYTVVDVGSISLNGSNRKLTLQGGASDVFVFNVANYAAFLGGGTMVLSGVQTNHVLFNLLNTSASANALTSTFAGVTLFGTFIAPDASMDVGSGTIDGGVFAGGNNLTINSETITHDVFMLPEPSSFALVGISCFFSLGLWARRRTRR